MSELSWWLSPHPDWEPEEDWPQEVPVVQYETEDEVAVIDPFLPPDRDFDPRGKPVKVLLTQGAHYRGTADFVERYGASVWVPPHAEWRKLANPGTTRELPRGVEAIELDGEPQQVVFFIREHATLVSGDVLSGTGGRLHVFVDEADREPLLASLERLAELPIERVIIPHGDPVLSDGAARIRAAVAEARPTAIAGGRVSEGPVGAIRPIAGAVIREGDRILAWDDHDPTTGDVVAVPLAGGIEFGETGEQAIARELDEEINATPTSIRFLGIVEDIFDWAGQRRHELWLLYDVELADRAIYDADEVQVVEPDGTTYPARWRSLSEFTRTGRLVPDGLLDLIQRSRRA